MTELLFFIALFFTSCGNSHVAKQRAADRHLEDKEFHIHETSDTVQYDSTTLYTGWYYVVDTPTNYKRQLDKSDETFYLDSKPIVTAKNITTFEIYESNYNDKKYFGLAMRLNEEGTENWSNATYRSIGNKLAFILDNRLLQVATVNSQITGGVTALNRGEYSRQELEHFKKIIESEK